MDRTRLYGIVSALSFIEDKIGAFREYAIEVIKDSVQYLGNGVNMELYLHSPHDSHDEGDIGVDYRLERIYIEDGETYIVRYLLHKDMTITEELSMLSANELYEIAIEFQRMISEKVENED